MQPFEVIGGRGDLNFAGRQKFLIAAIKKLRSFAANQAGRKGRHAGISIAGRFYLGNALILAHLVNAASRRELSHLKTVIGKPLQSALKFSSDVLQRGEMRHLVPRESWNLSMSHSGGEYGNCVATDCCGSVKAAATSDMLCFPYPCHKHLREVVEREYPDEACGILLSRRENADEVVQVIACTNADPEPGRRYSIAPEELIAAQKHAREDGLEILGFYHSHPDHPAEASPTDLAEAHWTGCVYLICSVEKGALAAISAVRLASPQKWEAVQVYFAPPESESGKI
jgi:proteasome lid subunit RPN8/RPN11